jgi:hypothetical protein
MKAFWGSGGIAPRILDIKTRWKWVTIFTPRPLYLQGKSPWHPLDRRLGGPQNRSGRGGKEKNSQPLSRLEPPIIQPLAQRYTTELSRLLLFSLTLPNTVAWSMQDITCNKLFFCNRIYERYNYTNSNQYFQCDRTLLYPRDVWENFVFDTADAITSIVTQ